MCGILGCLWRNGKSGQGYGAVGVAVCLVMADLGYVGFGLEEEQEEGIKKLRFAWKGMFWELGFSNST